MNEKYLNCLDTRKRGHIFPAIFISVAENLLQQNFEMPKEIIFYHIFSYRPT